MPRCLCMMLIYVERFIVYPSVGEHFGLIIRDWERKRFSEVLEALGLH